MIAVADELRNLTLHPHPQRNEWVTSCLVCGKSYDQVIEETVADYLNQTARPGETVREHRKKCIHRWRSERSLHFYPPGSVAGCRL